MSLEDSDPLDPFDIGEGFKDEPELPLEEQVRPTLPTPLPKPEETAIVKADPGDLGCTDLTIAQVPEKKQIVLPQINLPANITDQQKELVEKAVKDVVLYGAQASAMICKGTECPYAAKCPLLRQSVPVPIDSECPIELYAVQVWLQQFYREMEVNPFDVGTSYDAASAQVMAGLMLQIHRSRWGEAMNPILEQIMTSTGPGGIQNTITTGNYNTDYREKAIKQLNKIAKDNMQTRERKVALMKSGFKDKSKHAAEVTERLNQIKEEEKIVEMRPDGAITSLRQIRRFTNPEPEQSS